MAECDITTLKRDGFVTKIFDEGLKAISDILNCQVPCNYIPKRSNPQRLHATLSAAQEAVVVALHETLLLPLGDLLAVTREFI